MDSRLHQRHVLINLDGNIAKAGIQNLFNFIAVSRVSVGNFRVINYLDILKKIIYI